MRGGGEALGRPGARAGRRRLQQARCAGPRVRYVLGAFVLWHSGRALLFVRQPRSPPLHVASVALSAAPAAGRSSQHPRVAAQPPAGAMAASVAALSGSCASQRAAPAPRPAGAASRPGCFAAGPALRVHAGSGARVASSARMAPAGVRGARLGAPLRAPLRALLAPRAAPRAAAAVVAMASADASLAAYVASGPIAPVMGLTEASVAAALPTWQRLGDRLAKQLGLEASKLTPAQRCGCFARPGGAGVLRRMAPLLPR